jgi:hypothetical protein
MDILPLAFGAYQVLFNGFSRRQAGSASKISVISAWRSEKGGGVNSF